MKVPCLAIATLLLPPVLHAQVPVQRRAAAAADGAVRIQSMAGSVRVIGWDADTIAVTGTIPEPSAAQFVFSVIQGGAKLGVFETGTQPSPAEQSPAQLEIRVPSGSTVWIKTGSADVHVAGVTGSIDAYAVTGDIAIEGGPGEVVAESLAGNVDFDGAARSVRAKSATGAVTLRGAITDATATTVSGPLAIDGSGVVRGRFESVDGDIAWRGGIGTRSTLDFVNHAGEVRFELTADAAAEFVIGTYQGRLDNRLGLPVQRSRSALEGEEYRLRAGPSPGGQVSVRTFKGTIVLLRAGS